MRVAFVENCSFVENISDDRGGAAVSTIGSMSMVNISFSGNVFDCEPGMFLNYSAVSWSVVCGCGLVKPGVCLSDAE